MKTILFTLQVLTGLSTLGLLALTIIKAYHGHSSRQLIRLTLGFMIAFVTVSFTIIAQM